MKDEPTLQIEQAVQLFIDWTGGMSEVHRMRAVAILAGRLPLSAEQKAGILVDALGIGTLSHMWFMLQKEA